MGMLQSYFLIAWRNLRKNKVYSMINIAGLAIGLSVFWLMALYIADEWSYDRSWTNADRIYRVVQSGETPAGTFKLAITSAPFAAALPTPILHRNGVWLRSRSVRPSSCAACGALGASRPANSGSRAWSRAAASTAWTACTPGMTVGIIGPVIS